jgi:hypothetical protein
MEQYYIIQNVLYKKEADSKKSTHVIMGIRSILKDQSTPPGVLHVSYVNTNSSYDLDSKLTEKEFYSLIPESSVRNNEHTYIIIDNDLSGNILAIDLVDQKSYTLSSSMGLMPCNNLTAHVIGRRPLDKE